MKKKIEAMLKEAKEKLEHYNTNKDEIYLRAKINVLTELLSNAEGEVVEHPVTLDGICPKCKAELQINGILRIPSQPQKVERV